MPAPLCQYLQASNIMKIIENADTHRCWQAPVWQYLHAETFSLHPATMIGSRTSETYFRFPNPLKLEGLMKDYCIHPCIFRVCAVHLRSGDGTVHAGLFQHRVTRNRHRHHSAIRQFVDIPPLRATCYTWYMSSSVTEDLTYEYDHLLLMLVYREAARIWNCNVLLRKLNGV